MAVQNSFLEQSSQTPLMRQYSEIKKQCGDAILFFRLGDFYEMFYEDAQIAAPILDIALTTRDKNASNPVPLCGVPYHASKGYIAKLLDAGKKVAICEQVEDASMSKGIVKREIQRLITPGTRSDEEGLLSHQTNFICSVFKDQNQFCLAWVDIHTGSVEYEVFSSLEACKKMLQVLSPSEIIGFDKPIGIENIQTLEQPKFQSIEQAVLSRYKVSHPSVLGLGDENGVTAAIYLLLTYIEEINFTKIGHLQHPKRFESKRFLTLDGATQKNLELLPQVDKNTPCLFNVLDDTQTSGGKRLLTSFISYPLQNKIEIENRLTWVETLVLGDELRKSLQKQLSSVRDLERLMGRLSLQKALVRDVLSIRQTLGLLPSIILTLQNSNIDLCQNLAQGIDPCTELYEYLEKAIAEDPKLQVLDGGVVRDGFDEVLDHYRKLSSNNKAWIANLQEVERKKTNIASLKIGFNKVFGYFLEVTKAHVHKVPSSYIRKQTLVNAERFITQELKEKEDEILNAQQKRVELEQKLFDQVVEFSSQFSSKLLKIHARLSFLDVMCSFAAVSKKYNYTKPEFVVENTLEIEGGRHPIIEAFNSDLIFVPNDVLLNDQNQSFILLTGPNMAGKSTVMRQTALIGLMAQMGCFVPAQKAKLSIIDQIFTRIGAQDDLTKGRSTFMVEMNETAYILHHATSQSLVLLDEIGRGTSTYDGVSIAWAVSEDLHDRIGAKTIFATHYHELTNLSAQKDKMVNFQMTVRAHLDEIIFLRKMKEGSIQRSYGIEVAQLAGVPLAVIERAKTVLQDFEVQPHQSSGIEKRVETEKHWLQEELDQLSPDEITPKLALEYLYQWKRKSK